MGIAVTDEQTQIAVAVTAFASRHAPIVLNIIATMTLDLPRR